MHLERYIIIIASKTINNNSNFNEIRLHGTHYFILKINLKDRICTGYKLSLIIYINLPK